MVIAMPGQPKGIRIYRNREEKLMMKPDKNGMPATEKMGTQEGVISIPELYTNSAMINFSPFEFEMTLGLGSSTYQGVRPVVNVRMSPQFAKELARILSENVAAYENNFGQVALPEGIRKHHVDA